MHTYNWGYIVAQLLAGNPEFKLNAAYIEFENVGDPETEVTIPSFVRSDGIEYYDGLINSDVRDFLRVPLMQSPTLGVVAGYEDAFAAGTGNKLTYQAMSSGIAGVHGLPFSVAANSKVFGLAIVATPVFADRTQDVIFARQYYAAEDQVLKLASSQIGLTWSFGLEEEI